MLYIDAVSNLLASGEVHLLLTSKLTLFYIHLLANSLEQRTPDVLYARVCALLLVMIAPLKGQEPDEVPSDLQPDPEKLAS